jgi:DNA-binding MarR family transcriptional regulator
MTDTTLIFDFPTELRGAIGRLSRRLRERTSAGGLTPTGTSVLYTVVRSGPLRMSRLAELEAMNPTMLSRVVAGLHERGLVTRAADPSDRRATVVTASAAGRAQLLDIQRARAAVLGRELEALHPEQREILLAALPVLSALSDRLEERR